MNVETAVEKARREMLEARARMHERMLSAERRQNLMWALVAVVLITTMLASVL